MGRHWYVSIREVDVRDVDIRDIGARDVDMRPKFIPVDFAEQTVSGSVDHALRVVIWDEFDLPPFPADPKSDLTCATAYHWWDTLPKDHQPTQCRLRDCQVASDLSQCVCPVGQRLYRSGANCNIGVQRAVRLPGAQRLSGVYSLRAQCHRHPDKTPVRQVAILGGRHGAADEPATDRMKRRIDSPQGRNDHAALRRRGARVRQPATQQGAGALHPKW